MYESEKVNVLVKAMVDETVRIVSSISIMSIVGEPIDVKNLEVVATSSAMDEMEQAFVNTFSASLKTMESAYLRGFQHQKVLVEDQFDLDLFKDLESKGAKKIFISFDLWADIVCDTRLSSLFSTSGELREGALGKLGNIEIFTDGFREAEGKVLLSKTLYWFT